MVEITIKGKAPTDPRQRVLAIEAAVQAICQGVGEDPADAVMVLLTAAAHMTSKHTRLPPNRMIEHLASSLGYATVAADNFFGLKPAKANDNG